MVRKHLHFLPEDAGDKLSEARHGDRWLNELDNDQLTPMVRVNQSDYYVYEQTLLCDGKACIPTRFFTRKNAIWARCWKMELINGPTGSPIGWRVAKETNYEIPANMFLKNLPEFRRDATRYSLPDPALLRCKFTTAVVLSMH
jgi:hypothetical protein